MEAKQKYQKKNIRKKRKDSSSEHQEQKSQQSSQNLSKRGKKIKKSNYSNREIITAAQTVVKGDLEKYLDNNFDKYLASIYKTVNQYYNKHPIFYTNKIFSDEPSLIFNIKDNMDVNLEAYSQLVDSLPKQTKIEKIGLKSSDNQSSLQIPYLNQSIKNVQKEQQKEQEEQLLTIVNRILTENEYTVLKHRSQSLNLLEREFKNKTMPEEFHLYLDNDPNKFIKLFSLSKICMDEQRKIRNILDDLHKRQDPFYQYNKPNLIQKYKKLQNELIAANNIKNLQKSFSQSPIDFYNYHKANQFYQKKFQQIRFQKILNLRQFREYVNSKKPKIDRQAKDLLHTACSACFSQFSQIANPIQNCPQCKIRIHQNCQKIETRCHRCSYGRTSNLQKAKTSYCYICNRKNEKGLMILTVTSHYAHQYAHVYCLLLHGLWTIQNKQIIGKYYKPELQNHSCFYCNKNEGLFFGCSFCPKQMHGMCAYLHGVSLNMRREGKKYTVELNCCIDDLLQQRLKHQRRFKINFEKIVFKVDKQLEMNIDKWKKQIQGCQS